ncbi:M23 family metallopeptidase [Coraliomargarita sp. SDUM461003]|uniref:M23 family metallopeptidase n=1 Tax=Thalassobacterium maritimum TaxID=3041265 RepID=A0ABU1APP2_9BACT|nr:M23 family metallopeptidase [Coraliomargarita sp. SDUM461003]MDQ8206145.1 M23 family metallopeptidase [Coraliomargarita sp. SDUM461003]
MNKSLIKAFIYILLASILWRHCEDATLPKLMELCLRYGTPTMLVIQCIFLARGQLYWEHLKTPFQKKQIKYWLSIFNKWICLALTAFALQIVAIKLENTETEYYQWIQTNWIFAAVFAMILLPLRPRIDRLSNLFILAISALLSYQLLLTQREPRLEESLLLKAPFAEEFCVMNGGYSLLNNMLQSSSRAPRAFGVHMRPATRTFLNDSERNRPYPEAFGATILAPATGTVITANESIPDLPMGQIHPDTGPGNYLLLQIDQQHYLIFANLQQNSIRPETGERIQAGEPLAAIGKSGMFSEPVLLLVATTSPDIFSAQVSSLPILLEGVEKVEAPEADAPFFPTRNEHYRPIQYTQD